MTEGKAAHAGAVLGDRQRVRLHLQLGLRSRNRGTAYFSSGYLPERAARPRPPPADARHRRLRVAGLPERGRAPARRLRARRPAAQLEQPVGAGLHARRRRALRLGAPGRDVRQVAGAAADHRQRRHHEPRRHRGRALAGLAGRQPGAAQPARRRTPATSRSSTCSTTGSTATRRASTPTATASTTSAGPVIMDAVWRPIANAVMSPVFGPLLGDLDNVRSLGGLSGESYVDKDLRTLLGEPVVGPVQPLLLRQRRPGGVPRLAVAGDPRHGRHAHRRSRARRTRPVAQDRLHAPASCRACSPNTIPDHQPPDLPAGAGVRPRGLIHGRAAGVFPAARLVAPVGTAPQNVC